MSRPRKYRKGRAILNLRALVSEFEHGRYVIFRDKPLHPGWWGSWQMHYARTQIARRHLFYAHQTTNQE
ncbi:MAG: hypothetical protein ING29_12985 [Azospirillum sp.]|nr:hypothetical protein [Azospirillum sp.]